MTSRSLSVRLTVVDAGKVKAELREVGESWARSLKRIEDASRPTSRALLAVDGAVRQIRGSVEGLTGRLGPLGAATGSLNVLARATEGVLSVFDEEPIAVRIVALTRQLVEAQDELLSAQRKEIDRAIDQLVTDPGKRIARINRELDETRQRLDALRTADGEKAPEVEAAIAAAETLARRRIEAIERPALEAAARVAAANRRLIDDLQRQLDGLGDARQATIDQALSRLSDSATAAQRAEVERLAGALYDEKEAHEALALALREEGQLHEADRQLAEPLRTPTEAYAASLERLNDLLQTGAIEQETFNRALARADEDLATAEDRILRQSRERQDGVTRALQVAMADADLTLTTSQANRHWLVVLTGSLTAPRQVTLPASHRRLALRNATTGGHAITVGYAGGGAVVVVAPPVPPFSSATAPTSMVSPAGARAAALRPWPGSTMSPSPRP